MASRLFVAFGLAVAASVLPGCQEAPEPVAVRSLRASGETTFICRGPDGQGLPATDCVQGALGDNSLYALVTQTASAEVAVIRVAGVDSRGSSNAEVIDVDPSTPGITPLRVNEQPTGIASTPGGMASFVGVAEIGREGIFALPTTCLGPPETRRDGTTEPGRDLTTWPACSLPSAPGDIVVVVDPADDDGRVRATCDGEYEEELPEPASATRTECAADLRDEVLSVGRSKLVVTVPDLGQLAVIDAQELLDRAPGSYDPCTVERWVPLQVNLPAAIEQPLPDDLVVAGCSEPTVSYGPFEGPFAPQPAGMDASNGDLFVADQGAPVVHHIDMRDPCQPVEQPPLVATSLESPERIVTTTRVAVSPVTPSGERFVYAIDERGEKTASVIIYDISEGRVQRTPLVRSGAPFMPREPADRIEFAAAAKDVTFALHDIPYADLVTGEGAVGTRCDPNPSINPDSPAALARPNGTLTSGASPDLLRGVFGFVLLSNGQVAVIDVDDFDAACRRPAETNPAEVFDFRGCSNDPTRPEFYTDDGFEGSPLTVSGEVSCRVVEQHRARSAQFALTRSSGSLGIGAPSLRSYPRLLESGRGLAVSSQTPEGRVNPLLLGVDFENPAGGSPLPAQVYVGTALRVKGTGKDDLVIEPSLAEQASVVLPFVEPRAYPSIETISVAYEGPIDDEQRTGFFLEASSGGDVIGDDEALFCDMGVQGQGLTREVGQERFGLSGGALERFARRHADYVQITNELLPESDSYWDGAGASCGGGGGYAFCDSVFGDADLDDLDPSRDLRILRAYQDRLEVEPRASSDADRAELAELIPCCFPEALSYRVRAGTQWVVRGSVSGFRSNVRVDPATNECVFDCNPLRRYEQGRAFELSSSTCENPDPASDDACSVGPRTTDDVVCVYDAERGAVEPGGPGSECIYDGLTTRFAVYRGLEPSRRGMTYAFDVQGGFLAQTVPLTAEGTTIILPNALSNVPGFSYLAAVDSQDRGLMLISLRSLDVTSTFF